MNLTSFQRNNIVRLRCLGYKLVKYMHLKNDVRVDLVKPTPKGYALAMIKRGVIYYRHYDHQIPSNIKDVWQLIDEIGEEQALTVMSI